MLPRNASEGAGPQSSSSTPSSGAGETSGAVTVIFFAGARQAAGEHRAVLGAAAGSTVGQLSDRLRSKYGRDLEAVMATCAIWVNGAPAPEGTVLRAGDEVAVLPPVSGGCGAVTSTVMPEFSPAEAFDAAYLSDLGHLPLAKLRAKREACAELETELSYLRRLAQARIDLIVAESERRHLGLSEPAPGALVELLPQILGDHARGDSQGRLPAFFAPADAVQQSLTARVEEVLPSDRLGSLGELGSTELDELLSNLSRLERDVSAERRALHDIQDQLQEELVRRYRSGEATVDALLQH